MLHADAGFFCGFFDVVFLWQAAVLQDSCINTDSVATRSDMAALKYLGILQLVLRLEAGLLHCPGAFSELSLVLEVIVMQNPATTQRPQGKIEIAFPIKGKRHNNAIKFF